MDAKRIRVFNVIDIVGKSFLNVTKGNRTKIKESWVEINTGENLIKNWGKKITKVSFQRERKRRQKKKKYVGKIILEKRERE